MPQRKICVVLVDRANYGRLWPVMREIQLHPKLALQTVCAGTMLVKRFGQAEKIVATDGFSIDGRIYMELEGSVPSTMAKSIGYGIIEFTSEFQRLQPDMLLVIGDRYETLAAVIAAAYQNLTIAHIQGGEVSGSIDESTRHAISKFSHYHFPATERAKEYLIRMGENPQCVFNFGCPSGDYILALDSQLPTDVFKAGVGALLHLKKPFLVVVYHPVTTKFGNETHQVEELLDALDTLSHPTLWLWPNIDAGSDHISAVLRRYREKKGDVWLRLVKNYDPVLFQKLLKQCACAVGNSSSFIRDSTFSGTPVVLVGDRQNGRETGENLLSVSAKKQEILKAIEHQLTHGKYPPSSLYGTGNASQSIVNTIAKARLYTQKQLHYTHREV